MLITLYSPLKLWLLNDELRKRLQIPDHQDFLKKNIFTWSFERKFFLRSIDGSRAKRSSVKDFFIFLLARENRSRRKRRGGVEAENAISSFLPSTSPLRPKFRARSNSHAARRKILKKSAFRSQTLATQIMFITVSSWSICYRTIQAVGLPKSSVLLSSHSAFSLT